MSLGAVVVLASVVATLAIVVSSRREGSSGRGPAVVRVYNVEAGCQAPRTDNCRLGLARDPYARLTTENVIGYVWHGDPLPVECFIPDGAQVRAEDGTTSTKWYRVRVPDDAPAAPPGVTAWLTRIRVRAGTEPAVGRCPGM